MKTLKFYLIILTLGVTFACTDNSEFNPGDFTGIYKGTLTSGNPSSGIIDGSVEGTAEVNITDDQMFEIHFFGGNFDSTIVMNYYQGTDSLHICNTGTDFEMMYGHSLGEGHSGNGMMSDMMEGETEWEHHMSDEHQANDMHYGGFTLDHMNFNFSFVMNRETSPYLIEFIGSK